ncbi:MAG: helix-hairpin-helix domain-containing protein [Candidatus Stygibacter frigidus]|nr:helix-hairpin-helix domain-containing protein [Candidatus Stygibacter frigidus]
MFRPQDYFTFNERKILTFVLIMLFLGLGIKYLKLTAADEVFEGTLNEVSDNLTAVDIRAADSEELQTLPRIGPKLAERILAYRAENGFASVDDLINVKGIGTVTLERIRPFIVKFGESAEPEKIMQSVEEDSLIDINIADLEDFISLPGIGPVKGQRIIDRRNEIGKFNNVQELIEVKGIGDKTLAKILPYIKCER